MMRVIVMLVAVVVMAVIVMPVRVVVMLVAVVVMPVRVIVMLAISCVRNAIAFKQAHTHQERKRNISFDGMKNPGIFFDIAQAFF